MASFNQNELNQLRTQMYSGFVTKSVPRYEMRGAGSGRRSRQTGYRQVTNFNAYNSGLLGRVRDAVGIKNVNNTDEIRRIYDYIGGYRPPAPAAPAPRAAPQPNLSVNNPYKAEADRLLKTIQEMEAAKPKTMFAGSSTVSTPQNLQIAAASDANKRAGTNNFKRRSPSKSTTPLRTIQSVNV